MVVNCLLQIIQMITQQGLQSKNLTNMGRKQDIIYDPSGEKLCIAHKSENDLSILIAYLRAAQPFNFPYF